MTNVKLTQLIEDLESQLADVAEEIEEYEEIYGDDEFNASDASGGNFDDAYSLGMEHGEMFERHGVLANVIKRLKETI